MKILALCGSLRAQSSNARVLRVAQRLALPQFEITFDETLGALPHFNPDLDEENPPPNVTAFRAHMENCDGVLICTPEYAHGLPGAFKNALDWTVSSGHWMEKPVLILKSSRSPFAHDSLIEILTTLMAQIQVCEVRLSGNTLSETAMLEDDDLVVSLRAALADFARKVEAAPIAATTNPK